VSAVVVSTYAFVNPIVAVILGAWLLEEPMGPKSGLAGVLIISAVVLIQLSGRRQARRERLRTAMAEPVPEG